MARFKSMSDEFDEMKFKDTPEILRNARAEYIDKRWGQLQGLTVTWTDNIGKYLFYTNAGGAVAVLSFMGGTPTIKDSVCARLALASFCLGLVVVGLYNAVCYYLMEGLFQAWRIESSKYLKGEFGWKKLTTEDQERVDKERGRPEWLAWAAFGLFIGGMGFGGLYLFGDGILSILKAICPS